MTYEVELLNLQMETTAKMQDIEKLQNKFSEYTPLSTTRFVQDDLREVIKKEDFDILAREQDNLKKDLGRLCSKEELVNRLNIFNNDVNVKLQERPTNSSIKKVLGTYDIKIDHISYVLNEAVEKLDRTQADQDKEIGSLAREINEFAKDLSLKLDKNDATRIWKHFQRFAEYSDLKDLYAKCIPELAKFEQ
jgi:hypothetical protein